MIGPNTARYPLAQPVSARRSAALAAALVAAIGCAALALASLTTLGSLKYAYLTNRTASPLDLVRLSLGPLDIAIAAIAMAAGLALIVMEWRGRALTAALVGAGWTPRLIVLGGILFWLGHAIFTPGIIATGDAGTHVARVGHLAAAIRGGGSLFWDNYFSGGGTLLQFTGPVFHWTAAAIAVLTADATPAIKIATALVRVAAFWFMVRLLTAVGLSQVAACIGGLFYAGGFAVTYMISIRSTFPQAINLAAMPAILLCVERLRVGGLQDRAALFGLPLAGILMIGNHPPTVIVFALWVAVFLVIRVVQSGLGPRAIPALVAAAALTGIGSIFFLVPFALEKQFTAENFAPSSLVWLAMPPADQFRHAITWGAFGLGPVYSTYLGYTLIACALAGAVSILRGDRRSQGALLWLAAAPVLVLTLFVYASYVRQVIFTFFFAAIVAAAGADLLLRRWPARPALATLLVLAFLLETGPLAIQPWIRADLQPIEDAGIALAARTTQSRAIEVEAEVAGQPRISVSPDSSPMQVALVQEWRGPHKPDMTKSANPISAAMKLAEADLVARHTFSAATRSLLAGLNVGWIVGHSGIRMGLPADWPGLIADPAIGAHWRITDATPVLASGQLIAVPRPAYFDSEPFWNYQFEGHFPLAEASLAAVADYARRIGADPASRRAAAFLVIDAPSAGDDARAPVIALDDYKVTSGQVRLRLHADGPGFVRLAHPVSPFAVVTLNGQRVTPMADVFNLIVLPIAAGESDILITGTPSRLRVACFWITAITLAGLSISLTAALLRQRRLRLRRGADLTI